MTDLLDRFKGCLIGLAIGDAMGAPTEFKDMATIKRMYGFVDDLLPWSKPAGSWTDDTEMTIILGEALRDCPDLTDREQVMGAIAAGWARWSQEYDGARAPGGTCLGAAHKIAAGVPWQKSGQPAGPHTGEGCGAPMRCHPVGLLYGDRLEDLWYFAYNQGYATHQGPQTNDASVCQCFLISRLLQGDSLDDALNALMTHSTLKPTQKTAAMIYRARDGSQDLTQLLDDWRGWIGDEAFAAALACAVRFPDFKQAVTHAVNSPGDSDSLGCMCGALMGAKVGLSGIPQEWVEQVEDGANIQALAEALYERYMEMTDAG
jgi:ADP-ribosylglycohydrolase